MSPSRCRAWWCCGWLVVLTVGCTGDGFVPCTGHVSFDAEAVSDGVISFHPLDRQVPPQGGQIIAGRFLVRTAPGKHRVEILASRPMDGAVELTPGMMPREQFIPARYNDESTLEAEVTREGPNEFVFELRSARDQRVPSMPRSDD